MNHHHLFAISLICSILFETIEPIHLLRLRPSATSTSINMLPTVALNRDRSRPTTFNRSKQRTIGAIDPRRQSMRGSSTSIASDPYSTSMRARRSVSNTQTVHNLLGDVDDGSGSHKSNKSIDEKIRIVAPDPVTGYVKPTG